MDGLLAFSRGVDALNERLGRIANWLVLLACLISAGNAFSRYGFNLSSNAWLEIQWYLFAGMVMLGSAWTLNRNEHVRVDILYGRLSTRGQVWVDILGGALFLLACDIVARSLPALLSQVFDRGFADIPLGVITGLVGAPVFLVLLKRSRTLGEL